MTEEGRVGRKRNGMVEIGMAERKERGRKRGRLIGKGKREWQKAMGKEIEVEDSG